MAQKVSSVDWLAVDLMNLAHVSHYASGNLSVTAANKHGRTITFPTGVIYGVFRTILRLQKKYHPRRVLIACEGGNLRRREMAARFLEEETARDALTAGLDEIIGKPYKHGRAAKPPEMERQMPLLMEMFRDAGWPAVTAPSHEADDVLATWMTAAKKNGESMLVWSRDKDLAACVSDRVWLLRRERGGGEELTGPSEIAGVFGVPPARFADYLALRGDAVDSIPGVPGVGEKTARAIVREVPDIVAGLRAPASLPAGCRDKLVAGQRYFEHSRRMVELQTEIPEALSAMSLARENLASNHARVAERLRRMNMVSLVDDYLAWSSGVPRSLPSVTEPELPGLQVAGGRAL